MKSTWVIKTFHSFLLLFLSACGTLEAGIEPTVTSTAVSTPIITANGVPSMPPTTIVSATPTMASRPTLDIDDPFNFSNLRFAANNTIQDNFPAGTEEVFAWWDYRNMTADTMVKRIWYLNDQEWLVREVPWDFAKYGTIGTVTDISIYDFEGSGLTPGVYSLALYVNGVLQVQRSFTVYPK